MSRKDSYGRVNIMTFNDVVNKVKKEFGSADVSNYEDNLAIQVNVTGDGEGAFYTKIENGNLEIEGYDYNDNNAVITGSADDIIKVFSGKLDISKAVEAGKLSIEGDYEKALSIQPQIDNNKKKPAKKTASKSTTAKAATKKTTAKAESKETKAATKKSSTTKTTKAKSTAKKG